MPEMKLHCLKTKNSTRYDNCQKLFARHTNFLPFLQQYFYNKLTVRFLMYRKTFWVCWGPLMMSGKQAASWDVIRSCGSLLWKAAPSTPTIKTQVVYRHSKEHCPSQPGDDTGPISRDAFMDIFN